MSTSLKSRKDVHGDSLYESIKRAIESEDLCPGDRIRPCRELQKQFDISYAATLSGLRRLEDEGLVVIRPGSGTFVRDASSPRKVEAVRRRIMVVEAVEERLSAFYRPLLAGLRNMLKSGSASMSQTLMRWRVGLQFVAICILMLALYLKQS